MVDVNVVSNVVTALSAAAAAGGGTWFGLKYRINGMESRLHDNIDDVREDVLELKSEVRRQNGRIGQTERNIARLDERTTRPG